jgi:regulator of sirC expression with transglutaminase-like and TPR domain
LTTTDCHQDFRQAVDRPEDKIELGRAALAIAVCEYPQLDFAHYLSRIDQLAVTAAARLSGHPTGYRAIAALNRVLFEEHGFRGNRENYFDPRNSFLNEVLERKTGIPITLSVLYLEVAQRIGLALEGVGFPGHFLVRYLGDNEKVVLDPFNRGEIRSRESLQEMLDKLYGHKMPLDPSFLRPITNKQILRRMLNNLKMIYLRENALLKVLPVMEQLVILDPASAEDIRDRGAIYLKLECFNQALEDFQTYLRLAPLANDAGTIGQQIGALRKQVAQIH